MSVAHHKPHTDKLYLEPNYFSSCIISSSIQSQFFRSFFYNFCMCILAKNSTIWQSFCKQNFYFLYFLLICQPSHEPWSPKKRTYIMQTHTSLGAKILYIFFSSIFEGDSHNKLLFLEPPSWGRILWNNYVCGCYLKRGVLFERNCFTLLFFFSFSIHCFALFYHLFLEAP